MISSDFPHFKISPFCWTSLRVSPAFQLKKTATSPFFTSLQCSEKTFGPFGGDSQLLQPILNLVYPGTSQLKLKNIILSQSVPAKATKSIEYREYAHVCPISWCFLFNNLFWKNSCELHKKDNLGWQVFSLEILLPLGGNPKTSTHEIGIPTRISFIKLFCRKFMMSGNRPCSIFPFGRFVCCLFPKFFRLPHIFHHKESGLHHL